MAYSDGSGLVLIGFQDWPANVDPGVLVTTSWNTWWGSTWRSGTTETLRR
ncbi:MAG: hypothetical protein OEX04_06480 [Acidimicrobiia bacterium]|nr:hypothetical protein [Acidimicrobiia bacterium]